MWPKGPKGTKDERRKFGTFFASGVWPFVVNFCARSIFAVKYRRKMMKMIVIAVKGFQEMFRASHGEEEEGGW